MSATVITKPELKLGAAKFWMVLVGVNRYQDSEIPNLRYCANDCRELAETLEACTRQFRETEVISLYDGAERTPKLSEITTSIQEFRLAKPEDTVLFYFSGHGYLDSNNRPVLCVADTSLKDLSGTGLKLDTLLNELRQCNAQRQLVWLDACQEPEQQDSKLKQNPTTQLLAALEQQVKQSQEGQDFYAMLSCDTKERSLEISELKHGLFTYCLIEGLRGKAANNKGKIDADSLFKYVERSSKKFIKCKKNLATENSFYKALVIPSEESSPQLKVNRLPTNASQTPRRITRGGGELIIGFAPPLTQRKALIVDELSSSQADISLCRILQSRGSFEVEYFFGRGDRRRNVRQIIADYLQEESNRTVLLYLAGSIESTNAENYELVCDRYLKIDLNWLRQQLQDSPVREIIVIADILDSNGATKSLIEILEPRQDKSLCLIAATTSVSNNRKFLDRLVTELETAGKSEREFWASELITQLQKWCVSQPDTKLKLWLSGSTEVMEILSVEVQRSHNEIFEIDLCPYRGLKAFTQDEAYFFHGQDELIATIIDKLQSTSFLAIVGASGSGKSSVVRAGVIPQLLNNTGLEPHLSSQSWVMLPGNEPLVSLAKALAPENPEFLEGVLHLGVDSFVAWLHQQPNYISILVIDQFEELLTPLTPEKERLDFLCLILGAIEKSGDRFKVIITLRGDYLEECLKIEGLAQLIQKYQILVPSCRLEESQYRQIIAQPARQVGLEVEEGLMALLLEQLREATLPLLQYALEELWQKRRPGKLTIQDYQKYIGNLGEFLSNKADETYNKLSETEQKCAQAIFLSLVFLGEEQKDARRRLSISDLLINKYQNVFDSTLKALIDARLIVVSREGDRLSSVELESHSTSDLAVSGAVEEAKLGQNKDKVTVEVAHEILLRDWETLKWWLDENREKYRSIGEISQKANEWKDNGKQEGFLLSKAALAKYEEFYVKYADNLLDNSHEFIELSIQARDKTEKLAKRRNRQIIGGLTGGLVLLSAVAGAALWQSHQASINEINALSNSAEALLASNQELDALVTGLKAGKRIKNSFFGVDNRTKINLIVGLQNIFSQIKELNRLESHTDRINTTVFSPDGKIIASASSDNTVKLWGLNGELLHTIKVRPTKYQFGKNVPHKIVIFSPDSQIIASAGFDRTIKLWNLKGQLLHTLGTEDDPVWYVTGVVFSPDGQTIASFSNEDNTVKLWNLNGQLLHTLEDHTAYVSSIVFSPNGQTIASTSRDKTVKLWNLNGQLLHTFEGHTDPVHTIAFSPDGQTIASDSEDNTVKLWNLKGQLLHTLEGHTLAFSPDGKIIASASSDNTVKLWDFKGQLLHTLKGHTLAFSPDGKIIASASSDNTVKLWDFKGQLLHTLKGHTDSVNTLAFSPDGKIIASASSDKTIKFWNLDGQLLQTLEGLEASSEGLDNVVFSTDGQTIASVSNDKTIKLWNFDEELLHTLKGHTDAVSSPVFSPDGQTIASVGSDKTIKLWNFDGELLRTLEGHTEYVSSLVFSPDGKTIASASHDGAIKLWDLNGQLLHTLKGHTEYVNSLVFSPDGKTIASATRTMTSFFGADSDIKLWDLNGQLLHTLQGHTEGVSSVAFSPDSKTIASAGGIVSTDDIPVDGDDYTVKLWNLNGQLLYTFKGHGDSVRDVIFSPDGQTIASASYDNTVKLWNLKGQLLHTLKGHTEGVNSVVFSLDGQTIASASSDGTIKLWNLNGQLIHTLKGHTSSVSGIVLSSDGQTIASAGDHGTIKLWNLNGQLLNSLEGGNTDVVFSPDGQTIASASSDGTIKLWSLNLDDVMARGCDWARGYLTNNPSVSEEDRKICDGIVWNQNNSRSVVTSSSPLTTSSPSVANAQAEEFYKQGKDKLDQSYNEGAIAALDRAIALNPNYAEAYYDRGLAFSRNNKTQEAIENFQKAAELFDRQGKQGDAYRSRGLALDSSKDYQGAIAAYDRAISFNSNDTRAYNNRGRVRSDLKQYDQALADFSQAIRLDPNLLIAYKNRGRVRSDLKQYDQALADFDQAIRLDSNNADAYNNRGNARYALKQYDQALADYNQAIRLNPNFANAYYTYNNRGNARYALKQYDQALADFDQAIRLDSNNADAYNNRGNARYALKQYDQALADYNQAIRLNPNFANAYNNRGFVFKLQKDKQKALADFRKAAQLYQQQGDQENYQTALNQIKGLCCKKGRLK